ncbi:hypothetical protein [Pseudomonas sp. UMAB-08]|uniref:hypothetical protein n=1 Tax=Pseudomonas sp. UMAB-08 TaxID=1365375 RepID=UPI001C56491C|nr:hypothetical protein [Pseudomonas sp. UMAB-08]
MKLEVLIYDAFVSFSKAHTGEVEISFGFITTKNGWQLSISGATEKKIKLVSSALLKIGLPDCIGLDIKEHHDLTKQVIGAAYAEFIDSGTSPCAIRYFLPAYLKGITKPSVKELASTIAKDFTCHLPSASTGLESNSPFTLGPITIFRSMDWVDAIDFPAGAFNYGGMDNSDWRANLKAALIDKDVELKPLNAPLYDVLTKSKSMIRVTTSGYGRSLAQKLSTIAARTTLDSISLISGSHKTFRSLLLYTERRPPILAHSIIETIGFLWSPGVKLSDEIQPALLNPEHLSSTQLNFLNAVAKILNGMFNIGQEYPSICQRWSTALDWHGEACREVSDQIAIAKFGTCLDVLSSGGGKTAAIANMVSNLTEIPIDDNAVNTGESLSLYKAIARIYENGRSEILHGNKVDRMASFEELRGMAEHFSRITLISGALAFLKYSGADTEKAFCDMPPY